VKLCDFGIARAVSDLSELPEGALEGKAAYMSPEHARGEKVDARADVFSATTILWEILSGRRMYKAQEGRDVLAVAKSGDVPPLPDRGLPDYPRLSAIVSKGLARDRNDRYASAGALLDDLEDYVVKNRITASPMRFGAFLTEHFEDEIVAVRRERERHAIGVAADLPAPELIPTLPGGHPAAAPPAQPFALPSDQPAPISLQASAIEELDADDDTPDLDAIARESHHDPSVRPAPLPSDPAPLLAPVVLLTPAAITPATPEAPTPAAAPARRPSPAVLVAAALGLVAVMLVLAFALKG
jgi:serine/threonine protein kinase